MRTYSVRIIGLATLSAAFIACGDAGSSGEQPHAKLTQPVTEETPVRVTKAARPRSRGYEVVVIDAVRMTHNPTAINNRGQITGSAINDEDVRQAWFWDGEEEHFLVGERPDGSGLATDLNAAGDVVGSTSFLRDYSEMPGSFQFRTRAFLYDGSSVTDFGVLVGNSQSRAEGINRWDDVVGSSHGGAGEEHAVLYQEGETIDLGPGRAFAINNHRQVVGGAVLGDVTRAFLYSEGEHVDLGTLGGDTSVALDINERGEIVGNSLTADGRSRAFLYRDGEMSELPVPGEGSSAAAINRSGQIVGMTGTVTPPIVADAYLYENGEAKLVRDIIPQDGCWNQLDVRDINDHGDIVGLGIRTSDYSGCGEVGRYLVVVTRQPWRFR